jgi:hypothetical protein
VGVRAGLVLAALALGAVAAVALASGSGSAGAQPTVGHFCLMLETPATIAKPNRTAQRNSYVVLQAWEAERAAQLKTANPDLLVLVYQNLSAMAQGTSREGLSSSGVNYAEADTAYPEWFLKEASGKRIAEQNYPWLWLADVGNPAYQERWTKNVLATLQSGPWDGVFMDDTNTTAKFHVDPPSRIARYPTDGAYQAAVGSMLAFAGPQITATGKLAIPNFGAWQEYPEVVAGWLALVSGGMDQMFTKWSPVPGRGYADPRRWKAQLEEIQTTERMGKRFLAVTSAGQNDTQAVRYGWASALLVGGGRTAFFAGGASSGDTWSSDYEIPLGEPTSSANPIGNGGWSRAFGNGLVVVNPTTLTLRVSFGGIYNGSGLTNAEEATLAPHSAFILTRAAANSGEVSTGGGLVSGGLTETPTPLTPTPSTSRSQSVETGAETKLKKAKDRAAVAHCRRRLAAGRNKLSAKYRAQCRRVLRAAAEAKRHSHGKQ